MAAKADFNADEWSRVVAGPPAAGLRVVIAERGGTIRESLAVGRAYAEARSNRGESNLLDEIVAEQPKLDPQRVSDPTSAPQMLMEDLRTAVKTLEDRADPGVVEEYKRFVFDLAHRVASAKKEGGVLGIGGKPISDSERMALEEIAATLDIDPTEALGA